MPMRLFMLLPFVLAVAIVAFVAVTILSPHALYGVGEKPLASSIQGEIGFNGGESRCRALKRGYSCTVDDPSGGDGPRYLVAIDGGCWKARRPSQSARRARLEGCIGLGDYIRLPDLNSS